MTKKKRTEQISADNAGLSEIQETVTSNKKKRRKNAAETVSSTQISSSGNASQTANANTSQVVNGSEPSKKFRYVIQNKKVRKHSRKRALAIIMLIFIGSTIVLGALVYGISLFIQHNNLKIVINKPGSNVFSLSSTAQFDVGSEILSLGGPRYMDNTSIIDFYNRIPDIQNTNGAYRTEDVKFLAATVYFKNVTNKRQIYSYSVGLEEVTQNLDDAMRVMIVKGDEMSVYAKAKPGLEGGSAYDSNAIAEQVAPGQMFGEGGKFVDSHEKAWMAQPFLSPVYAMYQQDNVVEPGEIVRFTILVWLEGWDDECVDERLGGTVRIQLQFTQS